MRTVSLVAASLTAHAFAPFGVLVPDEGDGSPTADLEFLSNDGWANYITHSLAEIPVVDGALHCELVNRHDTHTQTLMPTTGAAVIVVAPAAIDFSGPSDLDTVRAFLVPQYGCVHLFRGTWHWGPYPVGADELRMFNIQGRGYPHDNGIAWFARDHGMVFAVRVEA
ncbi:MAG: ureidoglycolate lyase [Actinomycetota bacterium]